MLLEFSTRRTNSSTLFNLDLFNVIETNSQLVILYRMIHVIATVFGDKFFTKETEDWV